MIIKSKYSFFVATVTYPDANVIKLDDYLA